MRHEFVGRKHEIAIMGAVHLALPTDAATWPTGDAIRHWLLSKPFGSLGQSMWLALRVVSRTFTLIYITFIVLTFVYLSNHQCDVYVFVPSYAHKT